MTATAVGALPDQTIDEGPVAGAPLAMVVGPSMPTASVLARLAAPPRPLNDPAFLAATRSCLTQLRAVVGAPTATSFVVPGTGTSGLESVVASLLRPGIPVAAISTGMWGERWRQICARYDVPCVGITTGAGQPPDLDLLSRVLAVRTCQAVLVTHVDSSSGVRTDVEAIAGVARRAGVRVFVDGICAAGAETVRQDEWGVDGYLTGSPKALGAPAGLVLLTLSPAAVEALARRNWPVASYSLDLHPWVEVMRAAEAGRFAYFQTPAVNLVAALEEALRLVLDEGVEDRVARHRRLRDRLHAGLADLGIRLLVGNEADRSNGVTVCWVPERVDRDAYVRAVADAGVVVQAGTHPAVGSRTFRIGHLANVTENDVDRTLCALRTAHRRCQVGSLPVDEPA
jgi:alanine-glyoxylate transaminase/serine-glyoxylate transaminase/serine-pyruvate transaminase